MLKYIFVVSFFCVIISCQSKLPANKNRIEDYKSYEINLNFHLMQYKFDYVVNSNGNILYGINGNELFKYNLVTKDLIKVNFKENKDYFFDVVSSSAEKFGILFFDISTQYNIKLNKKVSFYEFDSDLNVIDSSFFFTKKKSHLLIEDFKYSSYYHDSIKRIFYFNHEMSYMKRVERNNWFDDQNESQSTVDVVTGIVYNWDGLLNSFILRSNKDTIIFRKKMKPQQLSVYDKSIVFVDSNTLIKFEKDSFSVYNHSIIFNPHKRTSRYLYALDKKKKRIILLNLYNQYNQ